MVSSIMLRLEDEAAEARQRHNSSVISSSVAKIAIVKSLSNQGRRFVSRDLQSSFCSLEEETATTTNGQAHQHHMKDDYESWMSQNLHASSNLKE
eukprot:CAMPEP_0118708262 /NCGR_PEP_ID=MMETSP0800-20121206/21766_1 /TAXON_ID=210618 ORGANISM="Striatella unipunctata, Strain CCMP2910" /NCGR_SAMPLE_ID=MMETSP0800 /ASSEMBLY_ACC=CAM_ASM_000638 /LENGTH=94 /DNA_ID=CAMNT_0006611389 /DNA_START=8 /DNA_END=292 /DNA_ORIENTATION=-